jgi:hypothetical protein
MLHFVGTWYTAIPQLVFCFCDDFRVPHLYTYAIGMKLVKECIECAMQVMKVTVLLIEEGWTAWNCFPHVP